MKNLKVDIQTDFPAFHLDVSFHMEKGVLGILGPSGCGKSMTLKSIAGIFTPQKGNIEVDDVTVFDSNQKINVTPQKRRIGYLFQNYALFPNMSVKQNIMAGMSKEDKKNTELFKNLVSQFRLNGLENHYPVQLSGGQQQRVALARIFSYKPGILLLDEPFSAMDSFLKEGLRAELQRVIQNYDGLTILVTHDRDEAYQLCDHILLMDEGKIIQEGKTEDVFNHPMNAMAARLTGCKNISRIEKIDSNHVKCLDWNQVILQVEEMNDSIEYVAIRSHSLKRRESDGINCFSCENASISQMPFEWHITLENNIWWKIQKDHSIQNNEEFLPNYLYIDPKDVLLLRK